MQHDEFIADEFDGADEDFISKTRLKNEAKALQDFARQLIALPASKIKLLPLNETTLNALADFNKQQGHIARNRHIAFIAKCLRSDEAEQAQAILRDDSFASLRQQQAQMAGEKPRNAHQEKFDQLVTLLLEQGDEPIEKLLASKPHLERQTLRQLVRNLANAKTEPKKAQALTKLKKYLGLDWVYL